MRDKWRKIKFEELGYTFGGLTNKTKEDFGDGKPYIPYLNIFENGKIDSTFLDYVNIKSGEKQNKVKYGDIFFTTSSETPHEVGMTSVLLNDLGEAYLNSFCFGFRLNNFEDLLPEFAVYMFRGSELRQNISDLAQGSTRYNLSKSIFFDKLYLNLPPLPQQRKIAKILSTCDTVIEKTEAAIAKYQAIKQGMMHDLFTRGIDLSTGKLRPKCEDAPELYKESELGMIPREWEVETFKDISVINQGLQIAISARFKEEDVNRYLYITIQYLNHHESESYRYYIENPPASVICFKDDILMVRTGNTGVIVTDISGAFHNNFFKIDYNISVLKDFLVYFLKRDEIQISILNYAGTTTIPDLKHSDFYKLPFNRPEKLEQELIANKLKSIDQKLQSEQSTLSKYRKIKSGLMQDLLSGKVEVSVEEEVESPNSN